MSYRFVCWLTVVVGVSFSGALHANEYLIFKRLNEDLGIQQLPHPYTVWHIDAMDYASRQIEQEVSALPQEEGMALAEQRLQEWGKGPLRALLLMSLAAREKMHQYGFTQTPSAVLLDDDGAVIKRWEKLDSGHDLIRERRQ